MQYLYWARAGVLSVLEVSGGRVVRHWDDTGGYRGSRFAQIEAVAKKMNLPAEKLATAISRSAPMTDQEVRQYMVKVPGLYRPAMRERGWITLTVDSQETFSPLRQRSPFEAVDIFS